MEQVERFELIKAFLRFTTHHRGEPADAYDDAAPGYDLFATVWDNTVAAPALQRFESLLHGSIADGAVVLEVAASTGRRTARVLSATNPSRVVALDASKAMLKQARTKIDDLRSAATEFLRVLKPDGRVIYAFCSLPEGLLGQMVDWIATHIAPDHSPLRRTLTMDAQPLHDCDGSTLARFAGGFTSVVTLGKCCDVAAHGLPGQLAIGADATKLP